MITKRVIEKIKNDVRLAIEKLTSQEKLLQKIYNLLKNDNSRVSKSPLAIEPQQGKNKNKSEPVSTPKDKPEGRDEKITSNEPLYGTAVGVDEPEMCELQADSSEISGSADMVEASKR